MGKANFQFIPPTRTVTIADDEPQKVASMVELGLSRSPRGNYEVPHENTFKCETRGPNTTKVTCPELYMWRLLDYYPNMVESYGWDGRNCYVTIVWGPR